MSNATSNLWWFVVTKTFKDIYELASPAAPFLIYGAVCVFGFFFILIFLPETRHGLMHFIQSIILLTTDHCVEWSVS